MKITKSWRGKGFFSARFLGVLLGLGMMFGFLVPQVFADASTTRDVSPGAGTLKQAVRDAQDGDILRLKSGSYTGNWNEGREVEIDKSLTIVGEGAGKTTIDVPIKITAADKTVTLKNFGSPTTAVEKDFVYVSVDAKTNLTIEDAMIWGMLRGEHGAYPRHNATGINIGADASGSKITLNNVRLEKPAVRYGILNKASDTTIDINGESKVDARVVAEFDTGSNNILNINEGVELSGPSAIYTDTETIVVKQQNNLQVNLDGGKILGTLPSNSAAIKVFAVDQESMGMKVSLKNGAEISVPVKQSNLDLANMIFAFDPETTAAKNHEITVDASSHLYTKVQGGSRFDIVDTQDAALEREYSKLNNAAVVSVADKDGNRTIKVYDNGAEIEGLKDTNNIEKENHSFEGWYKGLPSDEDSEEFVQLEGGNYPTAQSGVNLDLYPKFLKKVKVTIGGVSYELKEGQTIESIEGIDAKLDALKKEDVNHRGYIMHGETGGDMSFTVNQVEDLKKYPITEDVTIEAVHDVTITVNGQPFDVEIGQTVADIADQDAYKVAKLDEQEEKYFSRLVNNDNNETFEETTPINNNIEVTTKHYLPVKIEGNETEYLVEEGKKLSEDRDRTLMDVLVVVQEAPVENKTFGRFVDSENKQVDLENYTVDKTTTIKPIYTVTVKIGGNTYTLDEGQKLNDSGQKAEIEKDLKQLIEDVKTAGTEFEGFVLSSGGEEELIEVNADEAEGKISDIMNKKIEGNTDIYAKYVAKVTINCPECDGGKAEFEVETGSKLADLLNGDQKANYEKAKYQKYESDPEREERFGGFVTDGDEEFGEEQEIEKSMTLTPKYYVFVTVVDERPNVGGKYKVETGKDLDEMVPLNGSVADTSEVLATLRSDIAPDLDPEVDPEAEDLHFDRLVTSGTKDLLDETITKDVDIAALYHYDVIVVKDYDEPNTDLGAVDSGVYGFKVYRGEGLGSADKLSEVQEALEGLIKTATKPELGRKFYRFYDEKMGVTYDEGALKDKAFNRHLYITAKVEYKVAVEGDESEYYVVEGEKINSSEALKGAMAELKEVQNKQFASYTWKESPISEEELLETVINEGNNEIGADYNVLVTINGEEFVVPEGKTLSDLDSNEQEQARKALQDIQDKVKADEQTFEGYSVGGKDIDDVMKYPFNINTQVIEKTSITVTIDGTTYEDLESGDTIAKKVPDLDSYKTKRDGEDMEFSRFVDEEDKTFDENTPLAKNKTLTTKYAYKVTIDGDGSYRVEDGLKLSEVPKVAGKLAELKTAKPEKTFGRFEDGHGKEIDEDAMLTESTTITPIYRVTVKIGNNSYLLDENGKLSDLRNGEELTAQLKDLENLTDKKFYKYFVNGQELDHDGLMGMAFNDNATVEVKYNVEVTVGDKSVLLPEGTKYADATELISLISNLEVPSNKARVAYVTYDGTNPIGDDYVFDTNIELTPKYYVTLEFEGIDGKAELLEGEPVKNATELVEKLNDSKRDFNKFEGEKDLDTPISENTTLKPLYTINVTIQDHEGNSGVYKVDEGTTLQNLVDGDYEEPDGFIRFEDLEGKEVRLNDELHEHKTVKPIYRITVALPDGTEKNLESGQSLSDLGSDTLVGLKSDKEGRTFSRFVKKGTKETILENEPLYESLAVEPKFLNNIIVAAQDDEGNLVENSGDLNLELEEGLPLTELSEEQKGNLNRWLRDNMVALAEAGKPDYAFSHYIDENGKTIDGSELKNNDKIMAVFTYQPQATLPEVPEDTTDESAKSPDTGYNETEESASYAIEIVSVAVVLVGVSLAAALKFKRSK